MRKKLKATFCKILPVHCVLCLSPCVDTRALCASCYSELPWVDSCCLRCGVPLHAYNEHIICGRCLVKPPSYDSTRVLFHYQEPIRHFIIKLKFHQQLVYAKIMAQLWIEHLEDPMDRIPFPDRIIPIPLHKKRLSERGFNQSVEISRKISKHFNIPLSLHDCVRSKNTLPQSSLPVKGRRGNIRQAFALRRKCDDKHVVLFDDVMTTGETVSELSRLLKKSGVERVDIWCCARASRESVN